MKFKVGDRVRILDGSEIEGYAGCWVTEMEKFVGKVGVIKQVNTYPFTDKESYTLHGFDRFTFDGRGLKRAPRRIIIEEKNGKVTARLGKVRATVESESLEDGAKDALVELSKKQCKFKVGDVVEGISEKRYCVTKKGWIGRVTDICGDGIITVRGSNDCDGYSSYDVEAKYFKLKIPRD